MAWEEIHDFSEATDSIISDVGCTHKYPLMVLNPLTFVLKKSYPSFCFQLSSISVEFEYAQAVGVSAFSSYLQSICHGRFENL
jgi:hypothetical protein